MFNLSATTKLGRSAAAARSCAPRTPASPGLNRKQALNKTFTVCIFLRRLVGLLVAMECCCATSSDIGHKKFGLWAWVLVFEVLTLILELCDLRLFFRV